jgi:hypothetical protein
MAAAIPESRGDCAKDDKRQGSSVKQRPKARRTAFQDVEAWYAIPTRLRWRSAELGIDPPVLARKGNDQVRHDVNPES